MDLLIASPIERLRYDMARLGGFIHVGGEYSGSIADILVEMSKMPPYVRGPYYQMMAERMCDWIDRQYPPAAQGEGK